MSAKGRLEKKSILKGKVELGWGGNEGFVPVNNG